MPPGTGRALASASSSSRSLRAQRGASRGGSTSSTDASADREHRRVGADDEAILVSRREWLFEPELRVRSPAGRQLGDIVHEQDSAEHLAGAVMDVHARPLS